MNSLPIATEHLSSERHKIRDTATIGLPRDPEFKVAESVVVPDPVLVVDALAMAQRATQVSRHDEPMNELALSASINILSYVASSVGIWVPGAWLDTRLSPEMFFPMDAAQGMASDFPTAPLAAPFRLAPTEPTQAPPWVAICMAHVLTLP